MEISKDSAVLFNTVCDNYKAPIKWVEEVLPLPITQYEKDMLKGTITPSELTKLEKEEEEKKKELPSDEEVAKQKKRDYITMVKVVAIDKLGKYPLSNPSSFSTREKNKLIEQMKTIIDTYSEDQLKDEFQKTCTEVLFVPGVDFSKFPIYK